MAFVDAGTSRKIVEGYLPIKVLLAGAVVSGDPLMYSTGWKKSLNTSGAPAVLIAGEDGANGETITAYGMAIIECAHTAANVPTMGMLVAVADTGIYAPAGSQLQDIGFCVGIDADNLHSQILVGGMITEIDTAGA